MPKGGEQTDPLDALDALMGALNLTRLLLTRASASAAGPHAALPAPAVAQLQRHSLASLDKWLRARMDALWAEIQATERRSPPAAERLGELQRSFTHLHVATDVVARSVELCKSFASSAAVDAC